MATEIQKQKKAKEIETATTTATTTNNCNKHCRNNSNFNTINNKNIQTERGYVEAGAEAAPQAETEQMEPQKCRTNAANAHSNDRYNNNNTTMSRN